jgi:SPP1 family predicted phage head-tail adaptor
MNIGRLDRRITLQSLSVTRDEWNHPTEAWTDLATIWATKTPRRALEPTEEKQVVALNVVDWYIRHRTDVTADMRLKDADDNVFDIVAVQEVGRKEGLKITTERRA